ncbi:hypothetical protein SDC9_83841 [bioreactor metagenome]|uniref:Uncharacterized protein n=1 Tax=bioreactor metagenome TaxID=1076179 RepID=A0A644ZHD1_9ZZZZ
MLCSLGCGQKGVCIGRYDEQHIVLCIGTMFKHLCIRGKSLLIAVAAEKGKHRNIRKVALYEGEGQLECRLFGEITVLAHHMAGKSSVEVGSQRDVKVMDMRGNGDAFRLRGEQKGGLMLSQHFLMQRTEKNNR